jgi:RNA polymerase sigma factor (sigma-70 family)
LQGFEVPLTTASAATDEPSAAASRSGLGDAALEQIFSSYGPLILRWAERIFRDGMTADDVLHDVLLRVMHKGASFAELQSEQQRRAWLHRTTMRICWDLKARHKRERGRAEQATAFDEAVRSDPFEQRDLLDHLSRELDIEERVLAVLFFEEGYGKLEIHELTGRSRPFIDKKLARISAELERIKASHR